jgi:hypothetical protein
VSRRARAAHRDALRRPPQSSPPPPAPPPAVASANAETIAYAFFDIVAKCVFGFILVEGHAAIEDDKVASSEPGPAAVSTEAPLTGVVTANAGSA